MAAFPLFRDTSMAAMTSSENTPYVDCHSSEALVDAGYLSINAQIGANTRSMSHQKATTTLQTMMAC